MWCVYRDLLCGPPPALGGLRQFGVVGLARQTQHFGKGPARPRTVAERHRHPTEPVLQPCHGGCCGRHGEGIRDEGFHSLNFREKFLRRLPTQLPARHPTGADGSLALQFAAHFVHIDLELEVARTPRIEIGRRAQEGHHRRGWQTEQHRAGKRLRQNVAPQVERLNDPRQLFARGALAGGGVGEQRFVAGDDEQVGRPVGRSDFGQFRQLVKHVQRGGRVGRRRRQFHRHDVQFVETLAQFVQHAPAHARQIELDQRQREFALAALNQSAQRLEAVEMAAAVTVQSGRILWRWGDRLHALNSRASRTTAFTSYHGPSLSRYSSTAKLSNI